MSREARIEAALRECIDAIESVAGAVSVVEAYCQMGRMVAAIKAGKDALAPLPINRVGMTTDVLAERDRREFGK